jgi:hypothetical protein
VLRFERSEAVPSRADVRRALGVPDGAALRERVSSLLERAFDVFVDHVEPRALFEEVSEAEFESVYAGRGWNPPESPLPRIAPRARGLALYAATVGEAVSERVHALFAEGELPLAFVLDAVASGGADRLATVLCDRFGASLAARNPECEDGRVLAYSPGYCGWHVSGQRALFARLRPADVGISLNEGCLMRPLKSVSGVLVAGPAAIHRFRPEFPFCEDCTTHQCRRRMASVSHPGPRLWSTPWTS